MTLLPILHISAFVFNIWAIILVLNRKPVTKVNLFSALLCCTFLIWSLSYTFLSLATDARQAYIWISISALGWCSLPIVGLWFYLSLSENKIIQSKYFIPLSSLPALFFIYQQWTGQLVNRVELFPLGWDGVWSESLISILYFSYYALIAIVCLLICWNLKKRATSPRQKKQALLLIFTVLAAMTLGSVTDIIFPTFGIDILPQIGDVFAVIWGIGIVFSITKYGMLGLTPSTAAETIIDTMDELLMIINSQGKIVLVNKAVNNLFGNKAYLEGKHFTSIVADKDNAESFLKEASVNNHRSGFELIYKIPDGREIPMLVSSSILSSSMEPNLGLVVVAGDISQRKQFEAELREQKKLTDGILETIPNAVILIGYDFKIRLVNKTFYDLLKMPVQTLGDIEIATILPAVELLKTIENILEGRENCGNCEFRYKINGLDRILRANVLKMGAENLLIILSDVTLERQKQEKLYLKDRLASLGEMASGIAHELNNPLTSVLALSQLLKEENLPEEIYDNVELINKEAQQAIVIVKKMLTFARKHSPMKQPTQVNKVIEELVQIRAYEHMVSNIFVQTILADDLPAVTADYFQIQQVFLNIILNAEYAMAEAKNPGRLIIKTELENGYIKASISDNGIGIPRENLTRMFDPFFTTKGDGKGTGLGLSICYGIITSHNGRINVSSELGKGSTFIVELPVRNYSEINKRNTDINKDIDEAASVRSLSPDKIGIEVN